MSSQLPVPIYLDHNATTPVDPAVLEAMLPFFQSEFGNPSSSHHRHGNRAQDAVSKARGKIAKALGARESEIVFTSGCTEANNIALLGAARARPEKTHLITSAIEHPAVLEPLRSLVAEGFELTEVRPDETGRISPESIEREIRPETGLVSIMGANNEVGTTQPIAEIGAICEARDVIFHSDLAQVMAHRTVDVAKEHIHLASISGHKAYGPKGIGALYVRSRSPRIRLQPIVLGGGQEKGLRSGTLNVPLIVGLGEAIEHAGRLAEKEEARLDELCENFFAKVSKTINGVTRNGHPTERIAGLVSLSIDGVEPFALMQRLNSIASFSASSACSTNSVETSHVLLAMFGDSPRARTAFRVSPGRYTTEAEMSLFADALTDAVPNLRRFAA